MRSLREGWLVTAALMVASLAAATVPAARVPSAGDPATGAVSGAGAAATTPIGAAEIASAVNAVKQDPNLGGETRARTLRWVKGDEPPPKNPPLWIAGLFEFLGNTAGLLLWVLGAVAVAIAAVWVYRVARVHAPSAAPRAGAMPSQVLALDIRPASLPDDIGAAALQLLSDGRIREALSLLYRGALSRAVHRFGVNIDASYTEGQVLNAVQSRLDARSTRYFADLVRVWRRAVYAGESVTPEAIRPLCEEFRACLDGAAP